MSLFTHDMVSAISAVVATMGGVGPGLGIVGPTQNYAAIPAAGKIVLIFCMLLGPPRVLHDARPALPKLLEEVSVHRSKLQDFAPQLGT